MRLIFSGGDGGTAMRYRDSLACDFEQVFPYLSPVLVGERYRARLLALGAGLPSMDGGFESTLLGDGPPADISLRCAPGEPVARVITGEDAFVTLPAVLREQAVWRKAAGLLPEVPLDGSVWFEYDDADIVGGAPVANLIVVTGDRPDEGTFRDAARGLAALDDVVRPESMDLVERILARLPEGARMREIGIMEARPGRPVRLRLEGLTPQGIDRLATEFGWPGTARQRLCLTGLSALYPRLAMVIDIAGGCFVRFGVTMPSGQMPNADEHMPETVARLSWLLMQGLCAPSAARALRDWLGWSEDARERGDFPHRIDPTEPADIVGALVRVLVQFKLVFGADGQVHAKAYYGFLRRRSRRQVVAAPLIGARWTGLALREARERVDGAAMAAAGGGRRQVAGLL